jgi:hypothetical protein
MFNHNRQPSLPNRVMAILSVVLVLLLNVLAASPDWHARLHGQNQASQHAGHGQEPVGTPDHECAVTIFSHGAPALVVFGLLLLLQSLARSTAWHASDWLRSARLRYWHVPAHAPPLA